MQFPAALIIEKPKALYALINMFINKFNIAYLVFIFNYIYSYSLMHYP